MVDANTLSLIGAATSAGAYGLGQERTPRVLREHGLLEELREAGVRVDDRGDVVHAEFAEDPQRPELRNASVIAEVNAALACEVSTAVRNGNRFLVVGGDCSIELGVVAGARAAGGDVGLVYLDFDCDLNTPATTDDGAADWMVVAHLLDIPGSDPGLASVAPVSAPLLRDDSVWLLAADNATKPERKIIDERRLRRTLVEQLTADYRGVLRQLAEWCVQFDHLLIHCDVDVLARSDFPIAENDRDVDGLSWLQLTTLLQDLCRLPQWTGLTVTEINPDRVDTEQQFDAVVSGLVDAVAGTRDQVGGEDASPV